MPVYRVPDPESGPGRAGLDRVGHGGAGLDRVGHGGAGWEAYNADYSVAATCSCGSLSKLEVLKASHEAELT